MSKKIEALERTIDNYRNRLERQHRDHTAALNSARKRLEEAEALQNAGLKTLCAEYPNLKPLLASLMKAVDLADPGRAWAAEPTGSVSVRLGDDGVPEDPHLSSDGVSTRPGRDTTPDRNRIETIDGWLRNWAGRLERSMSPKEHRDGEPEGPQCWESDCKGRARPQELDAFECAWCGNPFGRYRRADITARHAIRRCLNCGAGFASMDPDAKFHAARCRLAYWRETRDETHQSEGSKSQAVSETG